MGGGQGGDARRCGRGLWRWEICNCRSWAVRVAHRVNQPCVGSVGGRSRRPDACETNVMSDVVGAEVFAHSTADRKLRVYMSAMFAVFRYLDQRTCRVCCTCSRRSRPPPRTPQCGEISRAPFPPSFHTHKIVTSAPPAGSFTRVVTRSWDRPDEFMSPYLRWPPSLRSGD